MKKTISFLLPLFTVILIALSHTVYADSGCDGYDPNSAKLPTGKGCKQPKKVIKYDPNCARLNGCANTQAGQLRSTAPKRDKKLLIPAVTAAPEAARSRRESLPQSTNKFKSTHNSSQHAGPDTGASSCSGVSNCNEMIATCIALGGNTTATSYDPKTGAPDGAICFSPGNSN